MLDKFHHLSGQTSFPKKKYRSLEFKEPPSGSMAVRRGFLLFWGENLPGIIESGLPKMTRGPKESPEEKDSKKTHLNQKNSHFYTLCQKCIM